MKINRLDHLVITVNDIAETCDFYERVLGVETKIFKEGRKALHFGSQKINLHEKRKEFEPKAKVPIPGSADLCFIVENTITQIIEHINKENIPIAEGPVQRTGAEGPITSLYIRDPDGNLLEISTYHSTE